MNYAQISRSWAKLARIIAVPIFAGLVIWVEQSHPVANFRPLTFIAVFFLLADIATLTRHWRRDIVLVVASIALGLCLLEAGAAFFEQRESVSRTEGLFVYQPVLGTGPSHPGVYHDQKFDPVSGAIVFDAYYTIDTNLLRQTLSTDRGPTIVFFGDSLTFGVGVNDADTLPQLFSDSLDRRQRVLNLAKASHGPQHFLRELETGYYDSLIGSQVKVVIFMTAAWHAQRNACKPFFSRHAPRYALENGRAVYKGPCADGADLLLREWLENSAAYRVLVEPSLQKVTPPDVDLYIETLCAAIILAEEKYKAPVLIPYINSDAYLKGTGFTDQAIVERLQRAGAIVMRIDDEPSLRIAGDGHPTPAANRMRAEMFKTYLERNTTGALASGLE